MGLNCSHGAWDGGYGSFMTWRRKIAEVAGLPPLDLMEGFYTPLKRSTGVDGLATLYCGVNPPSYTLEQIDAALPIKWSALKKDKLHILLSHSDCEGKISSRQCAGIADSLEKLIPLLPDELGSGHIGNWREKTQTFVDGLRAAAESKEPLLFR